MKAHLIPDRRLTLQEAFQAFCDHKLTSSRYRPGTQDTYLRALREFVALCSDVVYADELSLDSVQRYDEELLRRQQRPGSRHTKIAAVKAFFAYLEEQGALATPIAQAIAVPTQAGVKPGRSVDVDEAALLLRAAEEGGQARDVALVRVLLSTGISLGEVIDLTLADLIQPPAHDPGSDSTHAKPLMSDASIGYHLRLQHRSATQSQEASLDESTWHALNAYLTVRPNSPHPQIFLTETATPLSQPTASSIVKKYARIAGMPWIHSRALRTGYILRQLASGTPLVEVQSRLGHRNIDTTRRYGGLLQSAAHVAAAARRACGILIVDERQSTRTQLRLLLEATGLQVFEASDAIGASDMLRLSRLALVVLLALPADLRNASALIQHFTDERQRWADHRIILITADQQQIPHQVMNAGSQDLPLVSRPLSFPTLFALIAQAYAQLGGSSTHVENPA